MRRIALQGGLQGGFSPFSSFKTGTRSDLLLPFFIRSYFVLVEVGCAREPTILRSIRLVVDAHCRARYLDPDKIVRASTEVSPVFFVPLVAPLFLHESLSLPFSTCTLCHSIWVHYLSAYPVS